MLKKQSCELTQNKSVSDILIKLLYNIQMTHACMSVHKSVNGILRLDWECRDLEWDRHWNETFSTEIEEQPTGFLRRCARLFWLVKFARLLSKMS